MRREIIWSIFPIQLVCLFILSACDYGRMWDTPAVRPHEEPLLIMDENTVPFEGGEASYDTINTLVLESPIQGKDALEIERGKELYSTYCAQCHGKYHDGYGTVGQSFQPLPTDLRISKVQNLTRGKLFKEVSYGIADGRQPALATTIDPMDRWRIIEYIKSLGVRN